MGVYFTDADSVVDISLVNDAVEKSGPIRLLQSLDPVHGILTAKEHLELGLLRQPLVVESVDDTADGALPERLPTFLKQAQVISCDVETDEQRLKTRLSLNEVAASDPSPLVRLYVASGLQRLPVAHRAGILPGLLNHAEDATDHNLPFMYWYAAEGCVATNPDRALELLKACKIPKVREFIARRLTTLSSVPAK